MKNLRQSYTIASSKGQIVIPKLIRMDMKIQEGTAFVIAEHKKNILILKKISPKISKQDLKTLKMLEQSWKDVEEGRTKSYTPKEFFRRLRNGKL